MWMEDPDENGWGDPSTENPYFNYEATHSYGIELILITVMNLPKLYKE